MADSHNIFEKYLYLNRIPQLQFIVDLHGVKTLPELLGYLQLDRLLAADGPLIDSLLAAGTNIVLGGIVRPTFIQVMPRIKDYDWQQQQQRQQTVVHQAKSTRMSLMGRPVRYHHHNHRVFNHCPCHGKPITMCVMSLCAIFTISAYPFCSAHWTWITHHCKHRHQQLLPCFVLFFAIYSRTFFHLVCFLL